MSLSVRQRGTGRKVRQNVAERLRPGRWGRGFRPASRCQEGSAGYFVNTFGSEAAGEPFTALFSGDGEPPTTQAGIDSRVLAV